MLFADLPKMLKETPAPRARRAPRSTVVTATHTPPTVFLGLPDLRHDYVAAARAMGAPVLLSANSQSLARKWTQAMHDEDLPHPGFKSLLPLERMAGHRFALDSAGFHAMKAWGDYPWTIRQYVELAGRYDWEFWSSMDLCNEREIAGDRRDVLARIMRTAYYYDQCREYAAQLNIKPPMPVLQGFHWWDYVICAGALELDETTPIVGIGSVCRRHLWGPDGLIAILDQLDRELPKGIRFHLFGVISGAIAYLAAHPRVASIDSQAWGKTLRMDHPTGRTNALAVQYMERFYQDQCAHVAAPRSPWIDGALPLRPVPAYARFSEDERKRSAEMLWRIRNGDADLMDWDFHVFTQDLRSEMARTQREQARSGLDCSGPLAMEPAPT